MEEIIHVRFERAGFADDESKHLQKHISSDLLEKRVCSLVACMINPSPDELNEEEYTPIQQKLADEIKPYLKLKEMPKEEKAALIAAHGSLQLEAKTMNGTKIIDLEDELKDHPDIILTEGIEDNIGQFEQKEIRVQYWFPGSGQITY